MPLSGFWGGRRRKNEKKKGKLFQFQLKEFQLGSFELTDVNKAVIITKVPVVPSGTTGLGFPAGEIGGQHMKMEEKKEFYTRDIVYLL